jgi:ribosomal-protein-alanine N-acetyltransferase
VAPPADQAVIQPASWRDFRQVLELERACFGTDAWPWIDILAALTFPETVPLKAVEDGRLVGFVIGDRKRRESLGWIASIGVHPESRRRGVARRLLEACEASLGTPRVRLTLRASNTPAHTLYQSSGYVDAARWRSYYRDGEDAIVMEKALEGV